MDDAHFKQLQLSTPHLQFLDSQIKFRIVVLKEIPILGAFSTLIENETRASKPR